MISPDFVSKWKVLLSFAIFLTRNWFLSRKQSDQIGRFITLWATFQRSWQQLFYPKCQHILGNFCKFVKIFHFTSKILFGATFIDIWRFFTGHTARNSSPFFDDSKLAFENDEFILASNSWNWFLFHSF